MSRGWGSLSIINQHHRLTSHNSTVCFYEKKNGNFVWVGIFGGAVLFFTAYVFFKVVSFESPFILIITFIVVSPLYLGSYLCVFSFSKVHNMVWLWASLTTGRMWHYLSPTFQNEETFVVISFLLWMCGRIVGYHCCHSVSFMFIDEMLFSAALISHGLCPQTLLFYIFVLK